MSYKLFDGEIYIVEPELELSRSWMFTFFLNGHIDDYLVLYDNNNEYKGIINYSSLLYSIDEQSAVICDKLIIGDQFWEDVRKVLSDDNDKVVPVFNRYMEMVCLVKSDRNLDEKWSKLCKIQKRVDDVLLRELNQNIRAVHIKGINDVLYEMRNWLISIGIEVSVEGNLWEEIFDIKERKCLDDKVVVVDENCYWLDNIYMAYCNWLENHAAKLKKILCRPYQPDLDKKEKIMFYLPASFACIESINTILFYYLKEGKECICVFISKDWIMDLGYNNINNVTELLEKWLNAGVKCCLQTDKKLIFAEYEICFCLSEYSNDVPITLRKQSKRVVALQMTAIYTHMYMTGKFDEVFSEERREAVDYLVVSDYIADWICEHDKKWEKKILRFGYPKLDTLYFALKSKLDIPDDWKKRILNKSVYLFTTYIMEKEWLEYFKLNTENKIAIWRPHPNLLDDVEKKKKIEEICGHYNVILDSLPTYYTAFKVSNALITPTQSSVLINYLCTNKPVCLYSGDYYVNKEEWTMDYRNEIWYKCIDDVSDKKDVLKFIDEVVDWRGGRNNEQILFREYITSNFDGKVCERIYNFFENINNK